MKQLSFLFGFLLLSSPAFAGAKLPNPVIGQEVCFTRVYSPEHMKAHPTQAYTGVAVSLERTVDFPDMVTSSIYVLSRSGNTLFNGGQVLNVENTLGACSLPGQVSSQMDGDGGRFRITQSTTNPKQIQVKVTTSLFLDDVNSWLYNENVEEGTPYEQMTIEANARNGDSVMILNRVIQPDGSAQKCSEMLKNAAQ